MSAAPTLAVSVLDRPFDPEAELLAFRRAHAGAGAIASFLGLVRGGPGDALTLSHYPRLTGPTITAFVAEVLAADALGGALVLHRVGRMTPGEPIVLVAAASAHRRAAFEAVDRLMDFLKVDAPFWKLEEKAGRAAWIEPRAQDHADRARWAAPDAPTLETTP